MRRPARLVRSRRKAGCWSPRIAPILILHGTEDEVVPFAHAKELRALAQRPRLLRLEGAGHGINFSVLAPIIWDNIREMPR